MREEWEKVIVKYSETYDDSYYENAYKRLKVLVPMMDISKMDDKKVYPLTVGDKAVYLRFSEGYPDGTLENLHSVFVFFEEEDLKKEFGTNVEFEEMTIVELAKMMVEQNYICSILIDPTENRITLYESYVRDIGTSH